MSETQQTAPEGQTQVETTPTILNQEPSSPEISTQKQEPSETPKSAEKSVVPEKYSFTAPKDWAEKGYELSTEVLDRATPMLKELGLTQDQAQRLVEFYAGESLREHEAGLDLVRKQVTDWGNESKAHPDLKGQFIDGSDLKRNYASMINALGPELGSAFKEAMDMTGVGNHHAFLRAVKVWGTRFSEGTPVTGKGPSPHGQVASGRAQQPSAARALYPDLPTRG